MTDSKHTLRRRGFLGVVGAAGAALGCGGTAEPPAGPVDVGPSSDWVERSWKLICAQNLIVGRDEMGFYALSAICTHQGCTLNMASNACVATMPGTFSATGSLPTLSCPCHASTFNIQNGARVSGEAQRDLAAYRVTITAGRVMVDRGAAVSGSTRTAAT